MAEAGYLLSSVLMGLFLIGIALAVTVIRRWESYRPPGGTGAWARRAADHPATWMVAFLVLSVLFGAGTIIYVGGFGLPAAVQQAVGLALAVAFALVVAAFLVAGTYSAVKDRGFSDATAVGMGLWVFGLLVIGVIAINLIVGF